MVSSNLQESPVSGPEQPGTASSYVLSERCATAEDHQTAVFQYKSWGCSSAGRAPALQAGGRRFESDQLHHTIILFK